MTTEGSVTGNEAVIRAEGLTKVFGRGASEALRLRREGRSKAEIEKATGATIGVLEANFEVYPGEIFVIIGLSGSGKSTLLRLLNRLIEPTEGEVYLDGRPTSRMSARQIRDLRRKKMGMVFQHFGLLPNRSVLGNVVFGLEVQGISASERERRGRQALEMVGLEGQGEKRITELSGGMQQRVGLARALATEQEILLMDEPFSALDPLIRREMQNLFLDIQGEIKRTVVFVTHDLDEALRLGHRVAIMRDGEIVQMGNPEEILTNPANEYVERFIEDVDYTKVRKVEVAMVDPKEVAYRSEGPRVVLRRMQKAGLSTIFVLDSERKLVGLCEAEAVSRLAQRGEGSLESAIDRDVCRVELGTPLRKVLPLFVGGNLPVAVTDGQERLVGVVVKGSLIAALTTESEVEEAQEEVASEGGDSAGLSSSAAAEEGASR
ncbi:quaternary amine ABC transporter ATP-binding protein [Rubrobacter calidifluminis]|uniref:quaternary amine ABC transporter ATP-binding protein n=1 Tax=Rubrobacter calidifluminis TaxID=1392640 RepID=UPI003B5C7EA9